MQEDPRTEFKQEVSDKIAKAAVAFSNTDGGSIYVGIDDDGKVVGLSDPDSASIRCVQLLNDTIRPDIILTSNITNTVIEGKNVLRIDIMEGDDKPYYIREKGLRAEGVYIRIGSMNLPVSEETFRTMLRRLRSIRYEEMESFEQDLTFDFTGSIFRKKGIPFDDEKKRSLHLIENGYFTNLGFMLSDQFNCPVKAALFPDDYKSSFLDRCEFTGSIFEQLDGIMRFIRGHNTLRSQIVGVDRIDRSAYPIEAVREIVMNALIHRDYSMNGTILLSMYPDHMSISSPGGLDKSYTVEDLKLGVSALRNPNLANVMYRLGCIEAYGTGIPRMMKAYTGHDEPILKSTNSVFFVQLPSLIEEENIYTGVLHFDRYITRSDLESKGMSRNEAIKRINSLIRERKLEKVGGGRSTKYRIISDQY